MAAESKTADAIEARRWKKELDLAAKREKDWQNESDKIVKRYRGEEKKRNRYNVLWATTETLRPAIYNSKPSPDVRRRFRDADPVGKAVGEVLERSLFVLFDDEQSDASVRNDLLDALLSGRGVSRLRYVPQLAGAGETEPEEKEPDTKREDQDEGAGGSTPPDLEEGTYEQVEYEQVMLEHVDWRDYRQGYARVWAEVPWVGFRHKLIRKDAEDKFGADAVVGVKFAFPNADDPKKPTDQVGETVKTAEFWEVWDKLGERVFFVQEEVEHLLYPVDNDEGEPPIDFEGFFPCPEPLKLVENTGSQLPIPPFTLYENQANELDKISTRIDRIVNVCRLRGIYDAKLPEIADLLSGDDNELTPIQNAQQWADKGLDGAISWMPIEKLQAVLAALYDARDRQKQIIDELTGVSDIVRGATDPDETKGAQVLKANYHSIRLSRMQHEAQRYVKELMRMAAQVMACKFAPETFAAMTDLKFPRQEDKAAAQMQVQQAQAMMARMPQQPGQPPPAPPPQLQQAQQVLSLPSWEDIMQMMHSPAMRQFRVDVETDSTISAMLDSDMEALSNLLRSISQLLTEMAPMVTSGSLPVDAAKEIVMAVIRRARLGSAVEDAFDKMQMPQPQQQPQDQRAQAAGIKAQSDEKIAALEQQAKQQSESAQQDREDRRLQFEEQQKTMRESQIEQQKGLREDFAAKLDAAVKIITATIAATKAPDPQAQPTAESDYARQQ